MAMFAKLDTKMSEQKEIELLDCIDLAIGSIMNNLVFGYRFDKVRPVINQKFHRISTGKRGRILRDQKAAK
jgi:hypothetical protein